ncbi:MAG: uridine diphosphate-N-acetylglucosamine-binding protein YvcK [Candidatus Omnitrophica bacterium]|nr:uridine diphosphate-N-acetylglucosamine-binding protein YvcK [Candidatus Omnitrophota bacterium]
MKTLKWLYPGMLIKRWISLAVFGILMISMGFVVVVFERSSDNKAMAGIIIILGILCVIYSVKRILKSMVNVLIPAGAEGHLVEKIYQRRILGKGPKIVVVGGGTGLSTLLTGLKKFTDNITAIVTVSDDGGSSGRLREDFDVLPPGDIRNCLVALSDSEDLLGALFQFRFKEGKGLEGHNFGNLFIAALSRITGDFAKAIKESSKVLAIRGNVYPATLQKVRLVAKREDGRETEGESSIRQERESPIDRLFLVPGDCKAVQEAVDAIREADEVILGPGSLYTSIMPNLLIDGIRKAILKSRAKKLYICNVMTEVGETDNYSVSDHVHALIKHTGPGIIDCCVANITRIPRDLYDRYKLEDKFPVKLDHKDEKWLRQEKVRLVKAHIASTKEFVRHDPDKLSETIIEIINENRK